MATPVIMPKQGQSVESCIIVSWKKKSGDPVKAGETICEVETDKATFEVEAPAGGTVLAIFFEAGADVPVLTPIAAIGSPGENVDALRPRAGGTATAPVTQAAAHAPSSAASPSAAAVPSAAPAAVAAGSGNGKIIASPRAKALAAARGLSLAGLHGSGPGGRIIERDVQGALASSAALASPAAPAPLVAPAASATPARMAPAAMPLPAGTGAFRDTRVTGIRKLIAERMLASLQTTAQLTMHSNADAREIQDLRARFKGSPEQLGLRGITINDIVLYAVARSLTRHPDLNAHFSGDTVRQYGDVHLGFAVDTERGLMVPVIRNAHAISLREISAQAARLAGACRDGGIKPDELGGGTFTVTNLGVFGVTGFTPVLNVPQVGILGVGAIVPGPRIAADGTVTFIPQIGLSLTINHQVVDGAPGARFLQTVGECISRFELLLAG